MEKYINIFVTSFLDYWNYLITEITHLQWHSYFYWLVGLSLLIWAFEVIFPWRKQQSVLRKDFWLDGFYMFFNFFLFSLVGYHAISNVVSAFFNSWLATFGITNLVAIHIASWHSIFQFLLMFVVADFIQWNIHRLLHRFPWLWEFHKVHHSVEQMGFAAHFRFHWMETVVYKTLQYIPLAMIGFGITDFFIIHIITILLGHLNHSNININYGILKYIFNNPKMHIWHHAKELPNKYGVNFGLSLSIWDYLFKTAYIPKDGRDIELGFEQLEKFPKTFLNQLIHPIKKRR